MPVPTSESTPTKTILVVDDHPMMRVGAAAALSNAPDCSVVGETDNADDALEMAGRLKPNIVLTDIRLRGERTGVDLARDLRKRIPDSKIIVFTNFPHEPYVRAMMELGVEGYLLKDTPPSDVLDAIRMVAKGRNVFSSAVTSSIVRGYLRTPDARQDRSGRESLTSREAEVLQLVAEGRGNDEIAQTLGVTVKAIQVHLSNLYAKLGAHSRTEAVVQAAKRGLVVLEEGR